MRFALRTCALALASALTATGAATSSVVAPAVKVEPGLRAYEGRYTYQDEGSIVLVADGPRLVVVLGEAKYPLRQRSADVFTDTAGTDIPFIRDAQGRVIGFQEGGQTYRKLADDVPQAVRSLLHARSLGAAAWQYTQPLKLTDGIPTSSVATPALAPGPLPTRVPR